jgi:transposase
MLLRLAYLGITNAFALLRLLPGSDRDKDAEILALPHQLAVLQRQLGRQPIQPADRAWLAALLHPLPRNSLYRLRLLVRPDTILRWHRDLLARRHAAASRPRRRGRPPTVRSIRALVLRLVAENPSWGYRRVHGELFTLGIKVAASTVWEMLREAGIDPAPDRAATTWTSFCARKPKRCSRRTSSRRAGRLQAEHHWRAWDVAGDQRRQRCGDVTG